MTAIDNSAREMCGSGAKDSELGVIDMKIFGSTLFGATLLVVAIQHIPRVDQGKALPRSADATETPLMTTQFLPGECCNDDHRQALPLWEEAGDTPIAKP